MDSEYLPVFAGGGKEHIIQQLLQRFPQRFAIPRQVTDRKPSKSDKDSAAEVDFVKPEVLAKMGAQLVWSGQDPAASGTLAITVDALSTVLASGELVGTAQQVV